MCNFMFCVERIERTYFWNGEKIICVDTILAPDTRLYETAIGYMDNQTIREYDDLLENVEKPTLKELSFIAAESKTFDWNWDIFDTRKTKKLALNLHKKAIKSLENIIPLPD